MHYIEHIHKNSTRPLYLPVMELFPENSKSVAVDDLETVLPDDIAVSNAYKITHKLSDSSQKTFTRCILYLLSGNSWQ